MTTDTKPRILTTEAEFIAAEQAIAELRAKREALYAEIFAAIPPGGRGNEQTQEIEAQIEPLTDELYGHCNDLAASAPPSMDAAMIKLRLLTDEKLGSIENPDLDSLRQVIAFFEERTGRRPPRSHLNALGYIEDAIRVTELARGRLGKLRREQNVNGLLEMAITSLEAILASEFAGAAKDLANDLKLALGANFTVAEFDGARAVLTLILGALPPPFDPSKLSFLAAFRKWAEKERADNAILAGLEGKEADERFEAMTDNGLMEMVKRPAESAVDLALKVFLALWSEYGGDKELSLPENTWTGENAAGHYLSATVQLAISDDLVRLVPELGPMLDAARHAGLRAIAEEGGAA